jgi:hypothetical protein
MFARPTENDTVISFFYYWFLSGIWGRTGDKVDESGKGIE